MLHLSRDAVMEAPSSLKAADLPADSIFLKPRDTLPLGARKDVLFFRLADGCVALCRYMPDGRRQVCDIIGPGRLFGFAIADAPGCTVEALTFSTIECFSPRAVWASLPGEVALMLERQQDHAMLLGRKTAAERVASALLDLSRQFARDKTRRPSFPVFPTRGDLADWLGLTLETVSRCLHRFRREQLIDFSCPELIRILDRKGLERMSGAPS
jgi:CRP/FNR family transcriptional regulator